MGTLWFKINHHSELLKNKTINIDISSELNNTVSIIN